MIKVNNNSTTTKLKSNSSLIFPQQDFACCWHYQCQLKGDSASLAAESPPSWMAGDARDDSRSAWQQSNPSPASPAMKHPPQGSLWGLQEQMSLKIPKCIPCSDLLRQFSDWGHNSGQHYAAELATAAVHVYSGLNDKFQVCK